MLLAIFILILRKEALEQVIIPVLCLSRFLLVHFSRIGHFSLAFICIKFSVKERLYIVALFVIDQFLQIH